MNYMMNSFKTFLGSFKKLKANFLYSLLVDAIFYAIVALIGLGGFKIFEGETIKLQALPLAAINDSPEAAAQVARGLWEYFAAVGVFLLLFIAIFVAVYSIFKLMIWLKLENKEAHEGFYTRAIKMHTIWLICWGIVLIFFNLGLQSLYFIAIMTFLVVLYIHLTSLLHYHYAIHQKAKKAVSFAFRTGFQKIHKFIVPYILAGAVFFIWTYLLRNLNVSVFGLNTAVILIITVIPFFAWFRIYMKEVYSQL